ncbi:unnamed protein product [Lactuca saligna]|uniref:non-specific serine/threonine protein kinase n=1 Tax=Lactuca saligna TaxID=75948 RepID=A0AA36EHI9_LACSI|nr:unnamed protein product [Lactuca saligna]
MLLCASSDVRLPSPCYGGNTPMGCSDSPWDNFAPSLVLIREIMRINRVEFIHCKSFLHRDIKPDNFLMSLGRCANQVYAIDFGLAKKYRDSSTHRHIPYRENKNLTGTARYASMNPSLMEHKRSGLIWISSSPASPSNEGSVTLKNISLSRASLALLKEGFLLELLFLKTIKDGNQA